ncbi:Global nitrogen regulator [compost metagenome]
MFLRQAGETFGNAEVLWKVPRQRYARCLTDSLLIRLDSLKYLELMKQDAQFSYAVAEMGARRLLQTQRVVETLICRPAAWRLAWFLIQLGQRNGEQLDIEVQLSHEEISYVVGCSRQTVTEILNRWREQGLITYTKKKIVILQPESFLSEI